jgi:hypothetical protein
MKDEMLELDDEAWRRLRDRLTGLDDEEYLWEPAPVCWTLHPRPDGSCLGDWGLIGPDGSAPFTTIAWRMSHLIELMAGARIPACLGLDGAALIDPPLQATATDAMRVVAAAHDSWRDCVERADESELTAAMGPVAGMYADYTRIAFILHILDEVIHHGAEVGVLRDLFAATRPEDPFVVACLASRPDLEAVKATSSSDVDGLRQRHPDLLVRAAALGRWPSVLALLDLGFPQAAANGYSALHYAAGSNNAVMARVLVERGADLTLEDPTYRSTPLGWADHLGRAEAGNYLRSIG